jgi:aldose 1-epimerase
MRPAADVVVLENEHWRVGVVPETGASVAFGQVRIDGEWLDVLRPTPPESLRDHRDCASYVLAPWSNRVRDGRLLFNGREWQLRLTDGDGTAIHGTANEFRWRVLDRTPTRLVLGLDSAGFVGVNFPWQFRTEVTYALDGERFEWRTALANADDEAFPAGFGHHPYFVRQLRDAAGGALGAEALLQINCARGYRLEDSMALEEAGEPPTRADFRELRALGDTFVDDCLTGRTSDVAARISYPGALDLAVEADPLLSHVVVFLPVGQPFFAVEPVTNANDAFTLDAAGVSGVGVFRLQPGETREATFALVAAVWQPGDRPA